MGTNPIGPHGPQGPCEKVDEPVTPKGGAAANPKKREEESGKAGSDPSGPAIGPTGPSLRGDRTTGNY
jgi:hypothetical protein